MGAQAPGLMRPISAARLNDMSDPKVAMAMPPPTMSEWEREIAGLIVEALGLDVEPASFSLDEPLY